MHLMSTAASPLKRKPAVYMSYRSQNFRSFHVSNLFVLILRIFLLMYRGSISPDCCRLFPDVRDDSAVGDAGRGGLVHARDDRQRYRPEPRLPAALERYISQVILYRPARLAVMTLVTPGGA